MFDVARPQLAPPQRVAGGRRRILFVGHAGSTTGFARVLHSVIRYLPSEWEAHHLGINFHARAPECGWRVHANPVASETHAEGELPRLIRSLEPALVLVLDEPWACARHETLLARDRSFRTVLYAAIDGIDSVGADLAEKLAGLDSLVTFTELGRRVVQVAVRQRRRADPSFLFPPVSVIPHGVDTTLFRPLLGGTSESELRRSRRAARRRLFPDRRDLDDAFIVLNANRNQPFKRLDLTVEGFARFARGKPSTVKLFLHTASRRPSPSGEPPLVDRHGVRDRLLHTHPGEDHPTIPSEQLNLIYNACDVGLNTSEGEGWGLIAFEHAAAGAAQIVPRHSACKELWQGAATLVEPAKTTQADRLELGGRTVTAAGVANALERLYCDREHLRAMSIAAHRRATRREYRWQNIARLWGRHFAHLIGPSSGERTTRKSEF